MPLNLKNQCYAIVVTCQQLDKTRSAEIFDVADSIEDAKTKFKKTMLEVRTNFTDDFAEAKNPIIKDDYACSSEDRSADSWTEISIVPIPEQVMQDYIWNKELVSQLPF